MADTQTFPGARVGGPVASRIVVLSEPGRHGARALERARTLAAQSSSRLTVVAIAPQAKTYCRSCGGVSPQAYNRAICEVVGEDLQRATARLQLSGDELDVKLLIEGADPPLADWIEQRRFDLVLLPARRSVLRFKSHPNARLLRRTTAASVHVVRAARRHSTSREMP